jgi:tetratricopeptide (TPR) repeat protein
MNRLIIALLLTFGALAAPVVRAQDDATKAQAQQLYADGEKAYQKGKYADALASFQKAYDLVPLPALLYNVAQCYRRMNDHVHAVETYDRYSSLEKNIPAARQKELAKYLQQEKTAVAADEKKAKAAEEKKRVAEEKQKAADEKKRLADEKKLADAAAKAAKAAAAATPATATVATTPPATTPTAPPTTSTTTPTPATTPPATTTKATTTTTTAPPGSPGSSFVAVKPASKPVPRHEDEPLWTNPFVIGGAVAVVVAAAAGGTILALVETAPGPAPPSTSLGNVDLRTSP